MKDKKEFLDTIKEFNNPEIIEESGKIQQMDSFESLRNTVFDFYKARLASLEKDDLLKTIVKDALMEKIKDGEASFGQLMQLYKEVRTTQTKAVDSALSILQPTPTGSVSLLVNSTPEKEDTMPSKFSDLEPDEKDVLNKLANFANKLSQVNDSEE